MCWGLIRGETEDGQAKGEVDVGSPAGSRRVWTLSRKCCEQGRGERRARRAVRQGRAAREELAESAAGFCLAGQSKQSRFTGVDERKLEFSMKGGLESERPSRRPV